MCFLFSLQEVVWPAIHGSEPAACLHSSCVGMTGTTVAVGFQVLAELGEARSPGEGGGRGLKG